MGGRIQLGTRVDAIVRAPDGGYVVSASMSPSGSGRDRYADTVIVTTPLYVTSALVAPFAPEAAQAMAEVEYASAIMVVLAIPRHQIDHPLDASGFLVAGSEDLVLTACSWASSKWAHLRDERIAILRASAGRHHDQRALGYDDDELVDVLLADLGTTMGVRGAPEEVRVTRWERSLPQFRPGHLHRVEQWRQALRVAAPGLLATGAGFEGLGLPACIRQARETAEQALDLPVRGTSSAPPA